MEMQYNNNTETLLTIGRVLHCATVINGPYCKQVCISQQADATFNSR